ncbi:hypothetical protein Q428_14260 [Fervidicella metallireducens AeB]|uniref:Uncharacterized protein n=1 Tax=Fervidicella metallireducens AeB TaxID=1403537 RepID=A0A017RR63_9CLOT|nr:hypothetical protein [Fervidicella metallireducens]EYE87258.1 hypothetical protein Q428_14260 [Fervidicella metallireducens AeB]
MYNLFNWLLDVSSIWQFFKKLFLFILSILFILAYILCVEKLRFYFIGRCVDINEYILITGTFVNYIVSIMLPALLVILVIFYFVAIQHHKKSGGLIQLGPAGNIINRKTKPKFLSISIFILITFDLILFCFSANNFYSFSDKGIKKHSIVSSFKKNYNYSDIKEVFIGVKDRGRYNGSLYYKIVFRDGHALNISNYIISKYEAVKALNVLNKVIKDTHIKRNVDRTHFHDLVEGLDEKYVDEYEKLFVE